MNLNTLLFGIYPYVAMTVCIVGCWIRFDREQYTWKAGSSQLMRSRDMVVASNLFHIGILFILFGHLFGLLTPASVYHHVISTPDKQVLAMVSGGFFGLVCLSGLVLLIRRRATDPRVKATGTRADMAVLILLLIQLVLGLCTIFASAQHMDGSVMVLLATWAQSLVTLHPAAAVEAISNVHILYKLHVFFGLTLILVVPFTRRVHVISAPVWYLGRRYSVVRKKTAW